MASLLLLIPTTSYRTTDFMAAARQLGVDVVVGSDQCQVLEKHAKGATVLVDFKQIERGVKQILRVNKTFLAQRSRLLSTTDITHDTTNGNL